MAVPDRGLKEIKTLSSALRSGARWTEPHVHHFRLGALELERSRRTREKRAAIGRMKNIDARLADTVALIRKHQEALGITSACPEPRRRAGAPAGGEAPARAGEAAGKTRRVLRYGG